MSSLPDDLKHVDPQILRLVSPQFVRGYKAVPLRMRGTRLLVAVADAADARTLRAVQFATEHDVEPLVVTPEALREAIELYYSGTEGRIPEPTSPPRRALDIPDELSAAALDDLGLDDHIAPSPALRSEVDMVGEEAIDRLDELFGSDEEETVDLRFVQGSPPSPGTAKPATPLSASVPKPVAPSANAAARPVAPPASTAARTPSVSDRPAPAVAAAATAPAAVPSPPKVAAPPAPAARPVATPVGAATTAPPQQPARSTPSKAQVDARALLDRPDAAAIALVSSDAARDYHALPVSLENGELVVAFKAEPEVKALRALQYASGKLVRPVIVPGDALDEAILKYYPARVAKAPQPRSVPLLDPKLLQDRDPDVLKLLRSDIARKHKAIAIERLGRRLTVAMVNPMDLAAIQDLEFVAGMTIKALACDEAAIAAVMDRYYPEDARTQAEKIVAEADQSVIDSVELQAEQDDEKVTVLDLEELKGDEAPAVRLANMLIREAVGRGASDIHIESYEHGMRVRYRVDGILGEVSHPPLSIRDSLVSRIKVVSKMDISERRMPQDGRLKMRLKEGTRTKSLDFRVSVLPTIWGQKIVMRILDPDKLVLDMTKLGFDDKSLGRFHYAIKKPYGMVLVVGPSGCGKTNTLYSAMTTVSNTEVNIMTAEDPVEFNIKGINQVHVNEGVGLTFAAALRSFLRQDPNVILIGEIRDFETAEMAVKASLTGHLVLSTLHTTDSPTTVSRLINMGIEPFLVASSLLLVSAQRLVRVCCLQCKKPDPRSDADLLSLGFRADELPIVPLKGEGCANCRMTGYRGRTALFEVLQFTERISELVLQGATPTELKQVARAEGMLTLRDSGLRKIKAGVTTIDEVDRETMK